MKKLYFFSILLALSLSLIGCTGKKEEKVEIMVSAAVSLTDALKDIKELYEKDHAVELTYNLQGSGSLAQQIQQGAPVDVFISANQKWMDTLEDEELIITATRQDVTGNKLVLITGLSSGITYSSVKDISAEDIAQIAIGNPESVPAGTYAEQVLKKLSKWEELEDKLVLAKDVRQVLTYVETGNVDIGFVYESDALSSNKIQILATAEDGTHDPVIYPGAVLVDTKQEKEATKFLVFMASEQAQKILENYGFRK
ncbi:molybdate ABC transporter substrate-binding protein [Sporosarcina sp. CAU 1771]